MNAFLDYLNLDVGVFVVLLVELFVLQACFADGLLQLLVRVFKVRIQLVKFAPVVLRRNVFQFVDFEQKHIDQVSFQSLARSKLVFQRACQDKDDPVDEFAIIVQCPDFVFHRLVDNGRSVGLINHLVVLSSFGDDSERRQGPLP